MTSEPQKKTGQGDPLPGGQSDSGATMKAAPTGPEFDPRRLSIEDLGDPRRVEEALTHWDELEPNLLTAIESHPQHGPRLAMLRRADRWLERKAARMRPTGACPEAEELYDFGRGPGFGPVSSARRAEIERHLRSCRECENLVESLAALPPVPLEIGSSDRLAHLAEAAGAADPVVSPTPERLPDGDLVLTPVARRAGPRALPRAPQADLPSGSTHTESPLVRGPRRTPRFAQLLVAASLVLALGLWIRFSLKSGDPQGFPQAPLLRGSSGGPLFFPRDRALRPTPEARAAFPALDGRLTFEIEPVQDATEYRVEVSRHGGDAFAADEASILKLSGNTPTLQGSSGEALEPGEYTWTARALVRGLDQVLGARDFAVVEDPLVCQELADLASRSEPDRSLAALNLLHDHGYLGEARAIARAMPVSRERDEYLSRVPGR